VRIERWHLSGIVVRAIGKHRSAGRAARHNQNLSIFINGTDLFVGGMAALVTGPLLYFTFKRKCGGLTQTDPVN
jgi:hypothetical protein